MLGYCLKKRFSTAKNIKELAQNPEFPDILSTLPNNKYFKSMHMPAHVFNNSTTPKLNALL
jgi:hypothetical protein